MSESDDERRREDRIPINDEFARLDPSADSTRSTWVSDLSLGGVFVHTDELLPVGSMIELRFTILVDDPVVIEAFGKIVRHSRKPRGMGVAFAAINPDMVQRIEEVLARQRPIDSGAPLRLPEPRREAPKPAGVAPKPVAAKPAVVPPMPAAPRAGGAGGAPKPVVVPPMPAAPVPRTSGRAAARTSTRTPERGSGQERAVFGRPAPVEGLDLKRVRKREFEDAVTASFPRIKPASSPANDDDPTTTFKPPPLPSGVPNSLGDDDKTRAYRSLRRKDD